MNTYHFLSLAFCASTLISTQSFSIDIKEAKQAAQEQKKQYKKMKALINDIEDCWRAHHLKFQTLMEKSNYVPSSELVQVHAEELEAIRDRCLALEKFYEKNYAQNPDHKE